MDSSNVCMKLRDLCDFEYFCTFEGYNTDGNKPGDFMNDAYMHLRNQKRRN